MEEVTPLVAMEIREAMALLRRGAPAAARARAETALQQNGGHGALHAFLGMLCCRSGDFSAGVAHLRAALASAPDDLTIATNLATALVQTGRFEEAAEICSAERAEQDATLRLWRLRGYILQQLEDFEAAAAAYRRVVTAVPDDWESWNNLGNALAGAGAGAGAGPPEEALAALQRAADIRPDSGPVQLNLAAALAQAGRPEEAVEVLRRFSGGHPDDPRPLIERAALLRHLYRDEEALEVLGRAVAASPRDAALRVQLGDELMAAFRFDEAERLLRDALAIERDRSDAYIKLALLLEHTNRDQEVPMLSREAERAGADKGAIRLIGAMICWREQRLEEGLDLLQQVPEDIEPIRRAQLEGQFRDRLGDAEGAFAAFTEMNRLFKLDPSQPEARGQAARAALREDHATVTPAYYARWRALDPLAERRSPAFLVGFPRSGTTLLDTMLMGHPGVQVLEERPPLRQVEAKLGGLDRLAELDGEAVAALRADYFAAVGRCIELRPDALLVDKSPLHMNKVPLIHRLFPDARFILALRHPCDAVLSCFMTAFRLNDAMASFLDLETAAEYYDLSFSHWQNCTSLMPVAVHAIRYEDVVDDSEAELRRLLAYLGLEWQPSVIDHVQTARARGLITTASYAQVTERLYRRASGRWERYRSHLEPVLPVLAPWAGKFGYAV